MTFEVKWLDRQGTPTGSLATGNSVQVLLVLAGRLIVAGWTIALFSRRTS